MARAAVERRGERVKDYTEHGFPLRGVYFPWERAEFEAPGEHSRADMIDGRLAVARHRRPPEPEKPFRATFQGRREIGWFATMEAGRLGAAEWYTGLQIPPKRGRRK